MRYYFENFTTNSELMSPPPATICARPEASSNAPSTSNTTWEAPQPLAEDLHAFFLHHG